MTKGIDIKDFNSNEESVNDRLIKLSEKKDLILKMCQIDEVGFQTFKENGFEPRYNFFKNGNTVEIRVELPGNVEPFIKQPDYLEGNTIIQIYGEKKKDKIPEKNEDIIYNTRDFGSFHLEIPFKTSEYKISSKIKEKKLKNGLLFLVYDLDVDEKEEKVSIKVEEEF